jgi:hypothetical protein
MYFVEDKTIILGNKTKKYQHNREETKVKQVKTGRTKILTNVKGNKSKNIAPKSATNKKDNAYKKGEKYQGSYLSRQTKIS